MTNQAAVAPATKAVIFDVESTSKDAPKVVEAAYMYVDPDTLAPQTSPRVERFDPGVPIEYGAMAAHHILPHELVGLPPSESFSLPADVGYVIGHNVGFDLGAIGNPPGIKAIDTLILAQRAWPDAKGHTQSALYYMIQDQRGQDLSAARDTLRNAHSAGVDIQICATILGQLLLEYEVFIEQLPEKIGVDGLSLLESLHLISEAARVPLKMGFGKHEGMAPWNVPKEYKDWYSGVDNPNPYYLLSMHRGGRTPEGQSCFNTAIQVFGDSNEYDEEAPPSAAIPTQPRFKF